MAPTDGVRRKTQSITWENRKPYKFEKCRASGKVIWPWQTAWRQRIDFGLQYTVYTSLDSWVTEDDYLILKLTGKLKKGLRDVQNN